MASAVNVGLIGFGTVGAGVAKTLLEKRRLLEERVGTRVVLRRVCDRDFRKSRGFRLPAELMTSDASSILQDPEIQVVVELVGLVYIGSCIHHDANLVAPALQGAIELHRFSAASRQVVNREIVISRAVRPQTDVEWTGVRITLVHEDHEHARVA